MIDDTVLLTRIKGDFRDSRKHTGNWRTSTQESYKFIAGGRGQWDEQDVNTLEENERPVISFNRIGPYVDAISGHEINSRHTIKYLPRTQGDARVNELYTAAVKWVRDNCNAEDEESDAFVDVLACGMGWIETGMEYDQDQDGKIVMNRVDPSQMFWDRSAKKRNLEDRRWQSRSEWLDEEELKEKWPGKEITVGTSQWVDDPEETGSDPHNATLAFLYKKDQTGYDEKEKKYRVIHYQWWEHEKVVRAEDSESGKLSTFSNDRWEALGDKVKDVKHVKQKRRVYYEAFVCADTVLEKKELKCKGFTFKAITGKRNKVENTWYGLVENMKDPQRWANKFFSQILHIINSNAKGGLMAETGAFVDPKKAEEAWADPNAVVLLKNGGLAKVKERASANYPQGLDKLMSFAVGSIPAVSGINLETLGLAEGDQAGILEQERKKATFTVLAPFFDSLRRYRKEQGRLLFHYINEYLPEGTLIRVTTDQGDKFVPLPPKTDETLKFDMIVEESPTSPNQKQEVWQTMGTMLPPMLKAGMPLPADFFDYSPLPTELAQKMKASMQKKLPPEVEQGIQKMKQELQKLQQENMQLKGKQAIEGSKLQSKDVQAKLKADVTREQNHMDYDVRLKEIENKHQQHIDKLLADADIQRKEMMASFMEQHKEFRQSQAEQHKQMQHEMALALVNARADAVKEESNRRHEKTMADEDRKVSQETEKRKEKEKGSDKVVNAISKLQESIDDLKPVKAKKVRDKDGNMIAADVTYKSGDTRRITVH